MRRFVRVLLGVLGALLVALLGFAGWTAWELTRPRSDAAPDETPYRRDAAGTRAVPLPLTVEVAPVRRLALLEFEEGADPILRGFEPQVVEVEGVTGFRVLAYRRDGGVDVYDSPTLPPEDRDGFRVAGSGVHRYVQGPLEGVIERDDAGHAHIAFAFTDADGRRVEATLRETTPLPSASTTILAPIGSSSQSPEFFPLFLLNDFDFLRTAGSRLDVTIDGRRMPLMAFPVPLPVQGQMRSFAKYTLDPEIIMVFPTAATSLPVVATEDGTDVHTDAHGVRYLFSGDALERILVNRTEVVFSPPLDTTVAGSGRVTITSYPDLGVVAGPWTVRVDGPTARLELGIDHVTVPHQRDPLYRVIVSDTSLFATWPKGYRYEAVIDHAAGTIEATWRNEGGVGARP